MKLQKRIEQIITLTIEDFKNSGKRSSESDENLKAWLCDALMQDESIEDLNTCEISLRVLELLNSLDIVDLEFIHSIVLKDLIPSDADITVSFIFDEVRS